MTATNEEISWFGQPVLLGLKSLEDLLDSLPEFRRLPFGEGQNINEYLDVITRQPLPHDDRVIPVATVSKRYALIQHKEVAAWLIDGIKSVGFYSGKLKAEISISEYGERIRIVLGIPKISFDPGDGFEVRLMIEAQNSVDRSCAFEVRLTWRRLICSNGLWVREEDCLRKIHNVDWMNRKDVGEFLKARINDFSGMKALMIVWFGIKLKMSDILDWADDVLCKHWGVQAAARLCHIARSGYDGRVGRANKGTPAHEYNVSSDIEVPGACSPISNLYHLSQALSWIAGQKQTIEDSAYKTVAIPKLLERFLS